MTTAVAPSFPPLAGNPQKAERGTERVGETVISGARPRPLPRLRRYFPQGGKRRRKGVPRLGAILAPLLLAASAATAHSYQLGPLHIGHPWIQAPPPGAPTAAGYLSITNGGRTPDRLLGGETPRFARLEVHRMTMTGGIMRMRPATGGLEIAPGQTVTLAPGGGYHLMLTGPKHALAPGDHVPATLRFARAGTIAVDFHVQAGPGGDAAMPGMKMP